jgi:hypothetical protein
MDTTERHLRLIATATIVLTLTWVAIIGIGLPHTLRDGTWALSVLSGLLVLSVARSLVSRLRGRVSSPAYRPSESPLAWLIGTSRSVWNLVISANIILGAFCLLRWGTILGRLGLVVVVISVSLAAVGKALERRIPDGKE